MDHQREHIPTITNSECKQHGGEQIDDGQPEFQSQKPGILVADQTSVLRDGLVIELLQTGIIDDLQDVGEAEQGGKQPVRLCAQCILDLEVNAKDVQRLDQQIDPEKTVWEVISGGSEFIEIEGKQFNSRAYVARFNFNGADQGKKVSMLSGGEKNRLHLAMTLKSEANVLLLDEPTNDIDVNTLRALEDGLENFAGCAVVISHDRWFLDRIATHILAFEGNSEVVYFEGGYSDYEEYKKKKFGYVEPKRVRYRKLVEN